jgi:Xaa-Pro aminopeptidase
MAPDILPELAPQLSDSDRQTLTDRRHRLAAQFPHPVLLWAGRRPSRNFAANTYPFRASSHFLYFAGLPIEGAVIHLDRGNLTLFTADPSPGSALWHGPSPSRDELAQQIGAVAARPLSDLKNYAEGCATIALGSGQSSRQNQGQNQADSLGRSIQVPTQATGLDGALVEAIVSVRLIQDAVAIAGIERAVAVSIAAHRAGMHATSQAKSEAQVRSAMEQVIQTDNMTPAYNSIVTVRGEVLHNDIYHHRLAPGDLLLADVGAEMSLGWAADITRTWPVSGRFSTTQRAIYDLVLAAHDTCIDSLKPGVEYREIHLKACHILAEGLVDLGILKGSAAELVDRDAHALFFPHGIGHLLGLDVHDMEDLGDRAGYAAGRQRSDRFGLGYLRLDRPLVEGMVVTIEPGFYQVPALLKDPANRDRYADCVNWDRLAEFADVRGIRIEDDVLITATGSRVLTADLPTQAEAIEAIVQGGSADGWDT